MNKLENEDSCVQQRTLASVEDVPNSCVGSKEAGRSVMGVERLWRVGDVLQVTMVILLQKRTT